MKDFKVKYPTTKQVIYDAFYNSAALDAYETYSGSRVLPFYNLEKAKLIVSFAADFLCDWNGGGYEKAYAECKKPGKSMGRHIQIETNLSITGANADTRIPLKPTDVEKTLSRTL